MSEPSIRAAGAVLWRPAVPRARSESNAVNESNAVSESDALGEGIEVALVHRPRYDDWSLPKGKSEPGEHLLVTAVREVAEETGEQVYLGRPVGVLDYLVDGRPKSVHYWLAGGSSGAFTPNEEVDELVWVPPTAAIDLLTQPRDADVLRLLDHTSEELLQTTPLVLLRHAKAVKRSAWEGSDVERPLDERGRAQATALVEVLATLGRLTVVSSNSERTLATVEPYAAATGATVEVEPLLGEDAWEFHPEAALERIDALRRRGEPMVICSHRPLLPALIARACQGSDVRPPKRKLATAAFVVVHTRSGSLGPRAIAAEAHDGPEVTRSSSD